MDNTAAIIAPCETMLHLHRDIQSVRIKFCVLPYVPRSLPQPICHILYRSVTNKVYQDDKRSSRAVPALAVLPAQAAAQLLSNKKQQRKKKLPLCSPSEMPIPWHTQPCEKGTQGHHRWDHFPADSQEWGRKMCVFARSLINNDP